MLLDPARLLAIDVPLAALGTEIRVSAIGPGDDGLAAEANLTIVGRALRPPPPVALESRADSGAMTIVWTRRSRLGWTWLDGADAPLGEDKERYRLILTPSVGAPTTVEVDAPTYTFIPDAGATSLAVEVRQLGTFAASDPATATFPL